MRLAAIVFSLLVKCATMHYSHDKLNIGSSVFAQNIIYTFSFILPSLKASQQTIQQLLH